MTPLGSPSSWTRFFQEFHCSGCGNNEAYRSRPRGILEKCLLFALMLKPVRCDRCYHRSYIYRSVPVLERLLSDRSSSKLPQSTSDTGARVA